MQSLNVVSSNINKIAQLFPNCVTERKGKDGKTELAIDFEKLQAELSDDIIGEGEERYQFTWPDKRAANRLANTPTTMTLRPCREDSVDFDNTQNIYIEGDNLDVLKVLRETYLGKVKMIYIDPPYNTGNDFVYNDDFAQSRDEFEEISGMFDEEGNQTIDPMQRNTESNGRFHTDWLNMMYSRLKVAKDLLSQEGLIFISIGATELSNLIKICDEIYGYTNQAGIVSRQMKTGNNQGKFFTQNTDYIVVYAKNTISATVLKDEISADLIDKVYNKIQEQGKRKGERYRTMGLFQASLKHGGSTYPIICPDGEEVIPPKGLPWRWNSDRFNRGIKEDEIVFIKSQNTPLINFHTKEKAHWNIYTKIWLNSRLEEGQLPSDLIVKFENRHAAKELIDINIPFDFPKPINLIKYLVGLIPDKDLIILDFFSGSATTAHAVMKLNAEDGGNRKFIMVQLPEKTDEKSEAYKAGYKNICEIGKERIRRAGKKIKEDNKDKEGIEKLDIGFRVFKLDTSNMEDVYYTPQEFDEQNLFADNVKPDRTNEDLLFQVMLDLGKELSVKIEVKEIAGKTVHMVDGNYLIACFDENVNETTIKEIAKLKPVYFVMRDASAANDNVIDNFEQIFNAYSKETVRRIL